MPGFTTHYLFGLNYYKNLTDAAQKELIRSRHGVYSLGLQGPDVFFYYLPSYVLHDKNIGAVAHSRKTGLFLHSLIDSRGLFTDPVQADTAQAYVMGFLGHYLLDCTCHPYVYFRTHYRGDVPGYFGKHVNLETAVDTILLEHEKGMPPSRFHQEDTLRLTWAEQRAAASVLHYAYSRTYPELGIHYPTMLLAIRSLQWGVKKLRDPSGNKKKYIRRIEAVCPGYPILSPMTAADRPPAYSDPLNTKRQKWFNPFEEGQVSNASFYDLMETASREYTRIMELLCRMYQTAQDAPAERELYRAIAKRLGNRSYHSGLSL